MKNKKILALFAVPVIISMMVLPLCSFVSGGDDSEMDLTQTTIYHGYPNFEFGIYYYNSDSEWFYNDYISSVNQLVLYQNDYYSLNSSYFYNYEESNVFLINDEVDYYIKDYFGDSVRLGFDLSTVDEDYVDSTVMLLSPETQLTGYFEITDPCHPSMLTDVYIAFYDYLGDSSSYDYIFESYSLPNYTMEVEYYTLDSSDQLVFNSQTFHFGGNALHQESIGEIFGNVLLYSNLSTDVFYVSKLKLYPSDESSLSAGGVLISQRLFSNFDPFYSIYNEGFENGLDVNTDGSYSQGYNDGYRNGKTAGKQLGLSSASSVWKTLGTFLTETVGSITTVELWPNFSLGTLLSLISGALLLITFLKMFAGG